MSEVLICISEWSVSRLLADGDHAALLKRLPLVLGLHLLHRVVSIWKEGHFLLLLPLISCFFHISSRVFDFWSSGLLVVAFLLFINWCLHLFTWVLLIARLVIPTTSKYIRYCLIYTMFITDLILRDVKRLRQLAQALLVVAFFFFVLLLLLLHHSFEIQFDLILLLLQRFVGDTFISSLLYWFCSLVLCCFIFFICVLSVVSLL